jgi:hypothetical protein
MERKMTTTDDRKFLYPDLTPKQTEAVDKAYTAVADTFYEFGIPAAGDDRAENLVGAIARYLVDSRPAKTTMFSRRTTVDAG